jgi:hypothetical protein
MVRDSMAVSKSSVAIEELIGIEAFSAFFLARIFSLFLHKL